MSTTRKTRSAGRTFVWSLVGVALALTVHCGASTTDTGFRGKWQRSSGAAEVSIWEDPDGWRFCWSAPSQDNGPTNTCTEDGRTVMTERGETTFEYRAGLTLGPNPDEAFVEVVGGPVVEGLTPIRWTDRLELQADGLTILSWRVALNGTALDPPHGPLRLVKLDDEPR